MENEKRLIDANALMDAFRVVLAERHDRERCVSEENCKVCDRECLWRRVVKKAPTVDAVEVVHGRWEEPYRLFVECSECGTGYVKYDFIERANYCPNCGAKMDGERKNNV